MAFAMCIDSGAANAFTPVSTLNFNGGYNATFSNFNISTAFNDYFVFTLPSYVSGSGASDAIAGISFSSGSAAPTVQFSNFTLDTVTPTGSGTYSVSGTAANGTLLPLGSYPNAIASVSFGGLAQGVTYALNVTGSASNVNGGSYSGNIQFSSAVSPVSIPTVPEPNEWLMMISGFALVGFLRKTRPGILTKI